MKINGEFEVFELLPDGNRQLISRGSNVITNIGKNHICDWLAHDNYSDDLEWNGYNLLTGGRSVSDMKIMPYTDVQVKTVAGSTVANPEQMLYPYNNTTAYGTTLTSNNNVFSEATYNPVYGTVYFEFAELKKLKGIMIWGNNIDQKHYAAPIVDISTSDKTFLENTDWVKRISRGMRLKFTNTDNKKTVMWRFDQYKKPGLSIENVKTVRMRTVYHSSANKSILLWSITFFEDNSYPNTPSVIAVGTSNTTPLVTDTQLGNEAIRKFIRLHKDTGSETQVKYTTRLDYNECNNVEIKEIGVFFHPVAGDYLGGNHLESHCGSMFSRGLFDTPWTKTSDKQMDIDYSFSITRS